MQNIDPARLSETALALIAQAAIKADDESLETVRAVRRFLRGIQTGELVVINKPADVNKVAEQPQ